MQIIQSKRQGTDDRFLQKFKNPVLHLENTYQIDAPDGTWCHQVRAGEGGPGAWWRHVPSGAFAHRLFFGVFFSTGIPTSSYFLATSNGGLEVRRPDLAGKFARTGTERLGGLI